MRNHQIETLTQLSDDALKVVMKAEACTVANQIMRTYVVNENQVSNLQGFTSHW